MAESPPRDKPFSAKAFALESVLDYMRAMRTSPKISAEEAVEFANLETEFTRRLAEEAASTPHT